MFLVPSQELHNELPRAQLTLRSMHHRIPPKLERIRKMFAFKSFLIRRNNNDVYLITEQDCIPFAFLLTQCVKKMFIIFSVEKEVH